MLLTACGDAGSGDLQCFRDRDGDGWGTTEQVNVIGNRCTSGTAALSGDCDDDNQFIFPGKFRYPDCDGDGAYASASIDACDTVWRCFDGNPPDGGWNENVPPAIDLDCNDEDSGSAVTRQWFADCDGDTFYQGAGITSCSPPTSPCPATAPPIGGWTTEVPRNSDIDCDDNDELAQPRQSWFADCDGDGAFRGSEIESCLRPATSCADGETPDGGWANEPPEAEDCDDEDAIYLPGLVWFADCDGDGAAAQAGITACGAPVTPCTGGFEPLGGWTLDNPGEDFDCNDENDAQYPGKLWYADCDGDGAFTGSPTTACSVPADACGDGEIADGGFLDDLPTQPDCDDDDATRFPTLEWYADCDGDSGYRDTPIVSCQQPLTPCTSGADPSGWVHSMPAVPDCNDEDAASLTTLEWFPDCDADGIYASKPEDSCGPPAISPCQDGQTPDGQYTTVKPTTADCDDEDATLASNKVWFSDCDNDGKFKETGFVGCSPPIGVCADLDVPDGGWSQFDPGPSGRDCDDEDASEFPGQAWFADCDGDTAHNPVPWLSCERPVGVCLGGSDPAGGFVNDAVSLDCDDENAAAVPDEVWYADCDGDGVFRASGVFSCGQPGTICVDGANPDGGWTRTAPTTVDCHDEDDERFPGQSWYPDCDNDRFFANTPFVGCEPSNGWTCLDGNPPPGGFGPGAVAPYDCDDADQGTNPSILWYPDCDGDGSFSATGIASCGSPVGLCNDGLPPDGGWELLKPQLSVTDCDDDSVLQSPIRDEICFDGLTADGEDNDCDGVADNGCPFIHSDNIFSNETWVAGQHVVTAELEVRGATLTVEDGARVHFIPGSSLTVGEFGSGASALIVNGDQTNGDGVIFTRDTTWVHPGESPQAGDWGGITLGFDATNSVIEGITVEYAEDGIFCDRANQLTVRSSLLRVNSDNGLASSWCKDLVLDDLTTTLNAANGLYLGTGTEATVENSQMINNGASGLFCQASCMARDINNEVIGETFQHNVLTDNAEFGVAGMHFTDWQALNPNSSYVGNGDDAIEPQFGNWESGPNSVYWPNLGVPYRFRYFLGFGASTTTTLEIEAGTVIEVSDTNQLGIGTDDATRRGTLVIDRGQSTDPVIIRKGPSAPFGSIQLFLGDGFDWSLANIEGLVLEEGYIDIRGSAPDVATLNDVTVSNATASCIVLENVSGDLDQVHASGCATGLTFTCAGACSLDVDDSSFTDNTGYGAECTGGCGTYAASWTNVSLVGNGSGGTN